MRHFKSQTLWGLALVGGFSLVAAAVSVADKPGLPAPVAVADVPQLSTVFRDVARKSLPAVVTIETRQKARPAGADEQTPDGLEEMFPDPRFREFFRRMPRRQQAPSEGMGSGFIVDESGVVVTNNHVVEEADEIIVRLHDGREFRGRDVKTDPRTDLAIFRIDAGAAKLPALKFGSSEAVEVGDWVVAVGNPFGHELTVTSGIISAKGRGPGITDREDFLQTDAAINPGNSGGPLLNLNGDVVGVNTAISSRSGGFDGIGFAVPSRMAWWVVNQLMQKGSVRRAYVGVEIQPIDFNLAQQVGVSVGQGAIITRIKPGSPGDLAKLQVADVILSLDGQTVTSPRNLQDIVERLEVDKSYTIKLLRDGKEQTLPIELKAMPENFSMAATGEREGRRPRQNSESGEALTAGKFGFEVRQLTPQLAEQLQTEAQAGVVVSEVDGDGPASRVLAPGDVIERVGSAPVKTIEEFDSAIRNADPARGVLLYVRRNGAARFVTIRTAG